METNCTWPATAESTEITSRRPAREGTIHPSIHRSIDRRWTKAWILASRREKSHGRSEICELCLRVLIDLLVLLCIDFSPSMRRVALTMAVSLISSDSFSHCFSLLVPTRTTYTVFELFYLSAESPSKIFGVSCIGADLID